MHKREAEAIDCLSVSLLLLGYRLYGGLPSAPKQYVLPTVQNAEMEVQLVPFPWVVFRSQEGGFLSCSLEL